MSKISSYPSKPILEGSDILIGTSAENGQTKNFSVQALSNYAINVWLSAISWKFVILEPDPIIRELGSISFENFEGQSTPWANITKLFINTSMPNGTASINYLSRLIGKNIILGDRNNLDGYGVFQFDSLTQEDGSVYSMSLTYLSGSGVIKALHYYGIQIDVDAIEGDKNYVFTQAVASATWAVQHNLNKFPSCTIVLSTGQQGYGDVTFIDQNNLTITFASAESGKAYIN
tara:strand:- start:433 stop:1128 length:696 start_codon:yes stop_codon:yes gene_type:complete